MAKTIGISDKFVTAYETGDTVTLKVTGVVGMDFSGMQLASAVEMYANEGANMLIELDSVGGFVSDAFAFYDQVRAKGLRVSVDGYGMVASAATIIMAAAGRKRSRLSPNAEYLIHNASGGDAEGLKRANEKMADIYAELTGKDKKSILAKMREDKPMGADEARKWGFVGSVIELQKLAAKADKTNDMEENTVKEVRKVALTKSAALEAFLTGEVAVTVDVEKEAADQIAALTTEVQEATAKAKDAEDTITARDEAIVAIKAEVVKIEEAKNSAEAEVISLTEEVGKLKAEIEALKKTPVAAKVGPKGAAEPVVPGAADEAPVKFKKQTAEERRAAMAQMLKA